MLEVERTVTLSAGADAVWDLIGDFADLGWHPAVSDTALEDRGGTVHRALTLADGQILVEKLEEMDDAGRKYGYGIVEGPLPVADYHSALKVIDEGETCEVVWGSSFSANGVDDEEAKTIVAGIYEAGFKALKDRFG